MMPEAGAGSVGHAAFFLGVSAKHYFKHCLSNLWFRGGVWVPFIARRIVRILNIAHDVRTVASCTRGPVPDVATPEV